MKNFSLGISFRIFLILTNSLAFAFVYLKTNIPLCIVFGLIEIILAVNLYKYVTSLNRKMKRLFESIKYQDFAITFKSDNKLGDSFKDLNKDLNAVINSFNSASGNTTVPISRPSKITPLARLIACCCSTIALRTADIVATGLTDSDTRIVQILSSTFSSFKKVNL